MRKTICNSLILFYFDYACSSCYSGLTKGLQKKFKIAQNKVIRFIYNLGPRCSVRSKEFSNLGMLSVETRIKQMRLNHVYKIFNHTCPSYFSKDFVRLLDLHKHSTRGSMNNFYVPTINSIGKTTFYFNGILDWNNLPNSIKQISGKLKFKNEVKNF